MFTSFYALSYIFYLTFLLFNFFSIIIISFWLSFSIQGKNFRKYNLWWCGNEMRLMLIEDDPVFIRTLSDRLQDEGHTTREFQDPEEALEDLRSSPGIRRRSCSISGFRRWTSSSGWRSSGTRGIPIRWCWSAAMWAWNWPRRWSTWGWPQCCSSLSPQSNSEKCWCAWNTRFNPGTRARFPCTRILLLHQRMIGNMKCYCCCSWRWMSGSGTEENWMRWPWTAAVGPWPASRTITVPKLWRTTSIWRSCRNVPNGNWSCELQSMSWGNATPRPWAWNSSRKPKGLKSRSLTFIQRWMKRKTRGHKTSPGGFGSDSWAL